jgi:hypothetical protein
MPISRGLPKALFRLRLTQVQAVQIYYIIDGRNAWWQTWVQRYRQDCMQLSLPESRDVCERKRVQGTVFRITQLPAIAFRTSLHGTALLITQINTNSPLSQLRHHRLEGAIEMIRQAETLRILDEKNNKSKVQYAIGMALEDVEMMMNVGSDIYLPTMARVNSVMTLFTYYSNKLEALSPETTFQSWQSEGTGSAYRLGWTASDKSFDLVSFFRVVDCFQKELEYYKSVTE